MNDLGLKCCIGDKNVKLELQRRKSARKHTNIMGVFGVFKSESIACQIKLLENNKEMFRFDLQTLGF